MNKLVLLNAFLPAETPPKVSAYFLPSSQHFITFGLLFL